jgi:hypothetical protein
MRLTSLALLTILAVGCGGDDAEEAPPRTPDRSAPGAVAGGGPSDGSVGDTVARGPDGQTVDDREIAESPDGGPAEEARLYTVQVAAFTDMSTAESWAERLREEGMPTWVSVAESGGQTFYRLRIGVVPTVAAARRLGSMLTARYDWPVWIAPLTPADRMPPNAVEDTRRLLGTG